MYYLAFTPLWILVVLTDIFSIMDNEADLYTEKISIPFLFGAFLVALHIVRKELTSEKVDNVQPMHLKNVKEEKFAVAEFMMSFVFPMFAFDFTKYQGILLFSVFFLMFGWLCIKHNYLCVNVVLEIMKYKIYDCECVNMDKIKYEKKILSNRRLIEQSNTTVLTRRINNEYLFDCGKSNLE
mgnify:FL=1